MKKIEGRPHNLNAISEIEDNPFRTSLVLR